MSARHNRLPIPVILDTDIGEDIDDTWALCQLLKTPELNPLLVTTGTEDTTYRAKIACKFLETAGRLDVPVGIGEPTPGDRRNKTQAAWVEDYDLGRYPGRLRRDGVAALIDTVRASTKPVTLVCIGPLTNIRLALERAPEIAGRCHFVGMFGSIATGLNGQAGRIPENNVIRDLRASQAVFTADWLSVTITPLDSCGIVILDGARYRSLRESVEPAMAAVIENYRLWRHVGDRFEKCSSVLFDTVAIHLAYSEEFLKMEEMCIRVDDDGCTVPDPRGRRMRVATGWLDLDGYLDALTGCLSSATLPASQNHRMET